MAKGSLLLSDLQVVLNAQTIFKVGIERTFQAILNTMRAHNNIMRELFSDFVEVTTFEAERYGGQASVTWQPMDQLGVPTPVKVTAGATIGYPLVNNAVALQWSEMWAKKRTIRELAAQMNSIMDGDYNQLIRDIRQAIFYSANYDFVDYLVRGITLNIKRLQNADGAPIPTGPNGETFDGTTHTHYLARAGGAVAASDYDALVNTVREHIATGNIEVVINQADETSVRALTGFIPYPDARLTLATTTINAEQVKLDPINFNNRKIGIFSSNGAEVTVKPWGVPSYPIAWNTMGDKPIRWRYDEDYGQDMQVVYRDDRMVPLNSVGWRRIYGLGVYNRINCAILYTGGTTYVDPVIV